MAIIATMLADYKNLVIPQYMKRPNPTYVKEISTYGFKMGDPPA